MTQQQQPRIGIVIGSTREGRFGEKPAHWIHEIAKQRTDLAFELIDLRDYPLPFFNEPRSPAYGPVNNEAARLWGSKRPAPRRVCGGTGGVHPRPGGGFKEGPRLRLHGVRPKADRLRGLWR